MSAPAIRELADTNFDVTIIGAGINGAGIARDAAMRGLKVLLIDKGDVGGGTSSTSTRLIHGGLRYLEHGELSLVRESLHEREILFRVAPHLVRPIPFLVPIYKGRSRGWFTIRAGMIAYDLLSSKKSLPRHQMLSRAETLQRMPGLEPRGLKGAALYYDGHVEFPERLVLENVLSAREHGATVVTYAKAKRLLMEDARVAGVEVTGRLNGDQANVRSSIVVNAAGPWVDELLVEARPTSPLVGGTKGSHLVVRPFPQAPSTAVYVEAQTDGRPIFVIPWNGNYLIGTTDIRYTGDLDHVEISEGEIEYLLKETNQLFPRAALSVDSICFSYAGIRPLAYTENKEEQSITRRHFVREHQNVSGLISIVGGKLTTYRSLAEQAVDMLGQKLNRTLEPCATADVPLPGAEAFENFTEEFRRLSELSYSASNRLLRLYGTRAPAVARLARDEHSLAEVFDSETGALAAEIVFSFQHELAEKITDCMLRRTMVGLNATRGLKAVEAVGKVVQDHLGWSDSRVAEEICQYRLEVEHDQIPPNCSPRSR